MASRKEMQEGIKEMQYRIDIQNAWLSGEVVQREWGGEIGKWDDLAPIDRYMGEFDFDRNKYRIKPKPMDIWVVGDRVFFNEDSATEHELFTSGMHVRKFREEL